MTGAPKPPAAAEPTPLPGVAVGDELYFQHAGKPRAGRVVAHGKHGCTLEHEGAHHRIKWGHVLGHKKRAAQHYTVVDQGEDGMIVADAAGAHQFIAVPGDAKEDPMVMKSIVDGRDVVLFLKANGPVKNRPGLTQKKITDKTGREQTKWVRTNKDEGKGREPAAPKEPGSAPPAGARPNLKAGDAVSFEAGDFKGSGTVVGDPGNDGAHVKDASGRVHQVRWSEMTGHGDAGGQDAAPAGKDSAGKPGTDGALFSADEIAKLPEKVNQPVDSWEALVEKGTEGLGQFRDQLGKVAQVMGLQSGKKPEDITPEEWNNDSGFLFIAPLKGEKRAKEKVEADYGGDWSQLRDIVRATISVPTMGHVKQAIAHMRSAGIELAQKPKDRFAKPTAEGYRDLMTIVKLPNGMLAELQLHVKAMTLAKEEGHEHYNVSRTLQGKYGEAEPSEKWSDADHRAFYESIKAQKQIYSDAWSKASGGGESAGKDEGKGGQAAPLQKSLPCSKMIMLTRRG